jgi:hypothetical protein
MSRGFMVEAGKVYYIGDFQGQTRGTVCAGDIMENYQQTTADMRSRFHTLRGLWAYQAVSFE